MISYQHSLPDPIQDNAAADENTALIVEGNTSTCRTRSSSTFLANGIKFGAAVAILVVALLALLVSSSSDGGESVSTTSLRGVELLGASASKHATAKPDYNSKEGQYDWQKCKESQDPDCWKDEGVRVGGFWKSFGERMRAFWKRMVFWKKEEGEEEEEE